MRQTRTYSIGDATAKPTTKLELVLRSEPVRSLFPLPPLRESLYPQRKLAIASIVLFVFTYYLSEKRYAKTKNPPQKILELLKTIYPRRMRALMSRRVIMHASYLLLPFPWISTWGMFLGRL